VPTQECGLASGGLTVQVGESWRSPCCKYGVWSHILVLDGLESQGVGWRRELEALDGGEQEGVGWRCPTAA
jgi:hypothetical protein